MGGRYVAVLCLVFWLSSCFSSRCDRPISHLTWPSKAAHPIHMIWAISYPIRPWPSLPHVAGWFPVSPWVHRRGFFIKVSLCFIDSLPVVSQLPGVWRTGNFLFIQQNACCSLKEFWAFHLCLAPLLLVHINRTLTQIFTSVALDTHRCITKKKTLCHKSYLVLIQKHKKTHCSNGKTTVWQHSVF